MERGVKPASFLEASQNLSEGSPIRLQDNHSIDRAAAPYGQLTNYVPVMKHNLEFTYGAEVERSHTHLYPRFGD